MSRIWVKAMKRSRIARHDAEECSFDTARHALEDVCKRMDIPAPMWLRKHDREFESFRRTVFSKDNFFEDVPFDQLEVEFLEDDGAKRKSQDPRNAF